MDKLSLKVTEVISLNSIMWKPNLNMKNYQTWYFVNVIFLQLIPGLLIDGLMKLSGNKPLYVNIHCFIYLHIYTIVYCDDAVSPSCEYHIISNEAREWLCELKGEDWTSYFIFTGNVFLFLPYFFPPLKSFFLFSFFLQVWGYV